VVLLQQPEQQEQYLLTNFHLYFAHGSVTVGHKVVPRGGI